MRTLAAVFLRIGNVTFGGGDPTIAALHQELVVRRRWLSEEQYGLAFGLARITPGTNVLAFCAAAAWMIQGWMGAFTAAIAAMAPSAVVVYLVVAGNEWMSASPWVRAVMAGIAAAVPGVMMASAIQMTGSWRNFGWLRVVALTGGALFCSHWLHWPPVPVLGAAAFIGAVWPE